MNLMNESINQSMNQSIQKVSERMCFIPGHYCNNIKIKMLSCSIRPKSNLQKQSSIQWHTKVCEPLAENVNNFNKIREIIQNACYFLFCTVLSKIFYIKYVYI